MTKILRKEREIQQREEKILAVAQSLILSEGYHGLNMDRIAESLEYSKGTIYNHFPNKEEIILALGIRTMESRIELFRRASEFPGLSRERMQGIGVASEIFARLYPHHFFLEQMIRISSIWEKASERRRQQFQSCELQCMATVAKIVLAGVAENNLKLPAGFTPQDLVFGLWSLVSGAYSLAASNPNLAQLGINEPFSRVRLLANRLLDGFEWKPLSADHDYSIVVEKVLHTQFGPELARLEEPQVSLSR